MALFLEVKLNESIYLNEGELVITPTVSKIRRVILRIEGDQEKYRITRIAEKKWGRKQKTELGVK
jgi:hypothetical protein